MRSKIITGIVITLTLMGCSTSYIMRDDYDETVNFNELKSYDWKPINGIKWLDHKAFKRAVDETLSGKGYNLSPVDADFVIETTFSKKAIRRSTVGPRNRPEKGELILIFLTPDTEESIWHGMARVEYDSRFPMQKQDIDIDKAVSTALASFPPPPSNSKQ